jgi:hypothetical protein
MRELVTKGELEIGASPSLKYPPFKRVLEVRPLKHRLKGVGKKVSEAELMRVGGYGM